MNIDPMIRLVTICDLNGNIVFYRHREGVQNLLSNDESKQSLKMAMDAWKIRDGFSSKLGKGMYVFAQYEKVKRITMPFGDDLLLYLTTEVGADHSIIYHKIRELGSRTTILELVMARMIFSSDSSSHGPDCYIFQG